MINQCSRGPSDASWLRNNLLEPKHVEGIAVACNERVRATDKIRVNIACKNHHAIPCGCDMTKKVLETL